jgi:hypothetical protein
VIGAEAAVLLDAAPEFREHHRCDKVGAPEALEIFREVRRWELNRSFAAARIGNSPHTITLALLGLSLLGAVACHTQKTSVRRAGVSGVGRARQTHRELCAP